MEKVDVVDENLRVLYPIDKQEAHDKGVLHPTIVAEVINKKGEWLLVRQAGHKQDAGQFVSPVGGHVTSGESEIEALKREAMEEVGLKVVSYKRVGQFIFNRKVNDKIENHYFILYEIYSDEEPKLNDESVEWKRFYRQEIKKILKENPKFFGDAFHVVVRNFYSSLFGIDPV